MIKISYIILQRHFKMPQCILDNTATSCDYDDYEPTYDESDYSYTYTYEYTYTYNYTYNNKNLF
jgi:hypothetical protein